jgi:transcriptional regulator with XRE-family HTH domain
MAVGENIIGTNIYLKRIGRQMTQKALADLIGGGMTQPYIATLEKGKVIPTPETLDKIAKVFKIKPEALTVRANELNYADEIKRLLPALKQNQLRIVFMVAEEMTRER